MSRTKAEVSVPCLQCGEDVSVSLDVFHDPGCRYTKNGDGWPETWEIDILGPTQCPECHTPLDGEKWTALVEEAFSDYTPDDSGPFDTVEERDND